MSEKHLESALKAAGIDELPKKKKTGAFKGLAVIKMQKVGGRICWGLGQWNDELKKVNVARDFDNKMTEEILEAYPFQKIELSESPEQMEARIKAELEAKFKLKELGIDFDESLKLKDLTALIDAHQAELDKIQEEKDTLELIELQEWHIKRGYAEGHVNKWKASSVQAARDSKSAVLAVEDEIRTMGAEPIEGKKGELDAQLKELIKKKKDEEAE